MTTLSTTFAVRGLKRPGAPGDVPRDLPGFAGERRGNGPNETESSIKVPRLLTENKPNSRTNITVPYTRICPLNALGAHSGRLGRGEVLFLDTRPEHTPLMGNMHQSYTCMGIDGVNRLLVGAGIHGPRVGDCVLRVATGGSPFEALDDQSGAFTLDVLRRFKPDGIIIDNDRLAETTHGRHDSACFNVAIQGPAETANGYLYYAHGTEPRFNAAHPTGLPVHAHGSVESGCHIASGNDHNNHNPLKAHGGVLEPVDFVTMLCGTQSAYPSLMWDRHVRANDTLWLGLVAIKLTSPEARAKVRGPDGQALSAAEAAGSDFWIFQFMPFSSRIAWTIQHVADRAAELAAAAPAGAAGDAQRAKARENAEAEVSRLMGVGQGVHHKRHPFDKGPFDALRTADLRAMIGAYRIARVLDAKAAKHAEWVGGPTDTAYKLRVDVGIEWRATRAQRPRQTEAERDAAYAKMSGAERNAADRQRVTPERRADHLHAPLTEVLGAQTGCGLPQPPPHVALRGAGCSPSDTELQAATSGFEKAKEEAEEATKQANEAKDRSEAAKKAADKAKAAANANRAEMLASVRNAADETVAAVRAQGATQRGQLTRALTAAQEGGDEGEVARVREELRQFEEAQATRETEARAAAKKVRDEADKVEQAAAARVRAEELAKERGDAAASNTDDADDADDVNADTGGGRGSSGGRGGPGGRGGRGGRGGGRGDGGTGAGDGGAIDAANQASLAALDGLQGAMQGLSEVTPDTPNNAAANQAEGEAQAEIAEQIRLQEAERQRIAEQQRLEAKEAQEKRELEELQAKEEKARENAALANSKKEEAEEERNKTRDDLAQQAREAEKESDESEGPSQQPAPPLPNTGSTTDQVKKARENWDNARNEVDTAEAVEKDLAAKLTTATSDAKEVEEQTLAAAERLADASIAATEAYFAEAITRSEGIVRDHQRAFDDKTAIGGNPEDTKREPVTPEELADVKKLLAKTKQKRKDIVTKFTQHKTTIAQLGARAGRNMARTTQLLAALRALLEDAKRDEPYYEQRRPQPDTIRRKKDNALMYVPINVTDEVRALIAATGPALEAMRAEIAAVDGLVVLLEPLLKAEDAARADLATARKKATAARANEAAMATALKGAIDVRKEEDEAMRLLQEELAVLRRSNAGPDADNASGTRSFQQALQLAQRRLDRKKTPENQDADKLLLELESEATLFANEYREAFAEAVGNLPPYDPLQAPALDGAAYATLTRYEDLALGQGLTAQQSRVRKRWAEFHDTRRNDLRKGIQAAYSAYVAAVAERGEAQTNAEVIEPSTLTERREALEEAKRVERAYYVLYTRLELLLLLPSWLLVVWARQGPPANEDGTTNQRSAEYLFGENAVEVALAWQRTVAKALQTRIEALQANTEPAFVALLPNERRQLIDAYKAIAREYEALLRDAVANGRDSPVLADDREAWKDIGIGEAMDTENAPGVAQYVVRPLASGPSSGPSSGSAPSLFSPLATAAKAGSSGAGVPKSHRRVPGGARATMGRGLTAAASVTSVRAAAAARAATSAASSASSAAPPTPAAPTATGAALLAGGGGNSDDSPPPSPSAAKARGASLGNPATAPAAAPRPRVGSGQLVSSIFDKTIAKKRK